jgi:hypothetical protein
MPMKAVDQVTSQVELPWPVAGWVLGAHFYATIVPLALAYATYFYWDYLTLNIYSPFLFYIVVGLYCAGSAFEVAQNTVDRWYLTRDCGSALGAGFCDMVAFWFMTAGQAVMAVAIGGDQWWVIAIAVLAVLLFPVFYLGQKLIFLPLAVMGALTAVLAYFSFGDPVVFLMLLLAQVTMFFFNALLATGAQVLHGFTTTAASSGLWFVIWAIHNGEADTPTSWYFIIGVVVGAVILKFALWPVLTKLPMSPRIIRGAL